jgi:hypothetical protein
MDEKEKRRRTLLRSTEVACLLDLTQEEVIALADRGELKGSMEGEFWRFQIGDVAVYKSRQRKKERASDRSSPN